MRKLSKYKKRRMSRSKTMKRGGTKSNVYVVVEPNDDYDPAIKLYPDLYDSYETARQAVITTYDVHDDDKDVYVDENETGRTLLYVDSLERGGVNIIIQRYMLDK